jgi:hypothetical protein
LVCPPEQTTNDRLKSGGVSLGTVLLLVWFAILARFALRLTHYHQKLGPRPAEETEGDPRKKDRFVTLSDGRRVTIQQLADQVDNLIFKFDDDHPRWQLVVWL